MQPCILIFFASCSRCRDDEHVQHRLTHPIPFPMQHRTGHKREHTIGRMLCANFYSPPLLFSKQHDPHNRAETSMSSSRNKINQSQDRFVVLVDLSLFSILSLGFLVSPYFCLSPYLCFLTAHASPATLDGDVDVSCFFFLWRYTDLPIALSVFFPCFSYPFGSNWMTRGRVK
ncbi:MAG: hypothetical protein J3R72DRAFT_129888 [Linnemannia gamsii]|nr:MAG: hypothetical protein J3R72DRAFT_129888 [Linnemannia gamsii]